MPPSHSPMPPLSRYLAADASCAPAGDGPVAREPVDAALDGVPLLYLSLSKSDGLPPELPSSPVSDLLVFSGMCADVATASQARFALDP